MSIQIDNLSVKTNGVDIITDISLTAATGKITTIIGANGAGKSTLLKAITGDIPIKSGLIKLHNTTINPKLVDKTRSRNMAFLPQLSLLNFPYTVEEVVLLGRTPHETGEALDAAIIQQSLAVVEMSEFSQRSYTQLSGGEKQRVQLARVLAQIWRAEDSPSPRILLLDEPTISLDLGHQKKLMQFLQTFAQTDVAILMVLHNLNTAAHYSDELIALQHGKILTSGSPSTVLKPETIKQLFTIDCQIINLSLIHI